MLSTYAYNAVPFATKYALSYWKVLVSIGGEEVTAYFMTNEQARLAISWALEVRLSEIKTNPDLVEYSVSELDYERGSHRALTWWKRVPISHYPIALRETFSCHFEEVTRTIIGA